LLAIIEKRSFLNGVPTDIDRGTAGNGSIQRLRRPQIVHWHFGGAWGGAGGVIAAAP
jgi:hypothetical protein